MMPINAELLKQELIDINYDKTKTEILFKGFKEGFDIGYTGPLNRRNTSRNIPFKVGNPVDMWEKIMKEVHLGRYVGPYQEDEIPYEYFVQLPIGLVPKAEDKTRLIFHLLYDFPDGPKSINHNTPKDVCLVSYHDLDCVVKYCMVLLNKLNSAGVLFFGKTDLVSTFRILPIKPGQRNLLLMRAKHPVTQVMYYFIDKCLPFGSSISCAHFQCFSDALAEILVAKMNVSVINYLDNFLFISESRLVCDHLITQFILLCNHLGCLVLEEKTEKANSQMIFLGILLDGKRLCLSITDEKRTKAINALKLVINKKKITVKTVQKLTGLLNFLQRAVVPGRTFTRRMYDKLRIKDKNGKILKQHHHVCLDAGFREDCSIWLKFLTSNTNASLYRPFVDFSVELYATTLAFYADVSLNKNFGFGAVFRNRWIWGKWGSEFIVEQEPSIEFLELFALTAGILTWGRFLKNFRMIVFSDNEAVCNIVNNIWNLHLGECLSL